MNNKITIDDLTEEDYSIIRCTHRVLRYTADCKMSDKEFVNSIIDKYNQGDFSIILEKTCKVDLPDPKADKFAEISECVVAPKKQELSNVGKKIIVMNDSGDYKDYTLVSSSDEVNPDEGKISIHCDIGKHLLNAKQDDVLIIHDSLIHVIRIMSNLTLQPK